MGGKNSSESGRRSISRPSSFNHGDYSQGHQWNLPYSSEMPYYQNPPPSHNYDAPVEAYPRAQSFSAPYANPPESYYPKPSSYPQNSQSHSSSSSNATRQLPRLDRRYSKIADNYKSLDEVTEALAQAGLESSNLIVGIDFTKSNEWTGKHSFNRRSLHHISDTPNPYEQAISIIGKTLSKFDEDNLIPCFGFGDASTHDQDIFSLYPDERPCNGFAEALSRYREIVPHLRLAGPTSFAPIIEMAMTIVEDSGGQYHVLLIIADGQFIDLRVNDKETKEERDGYSENCKGWFSLSDQEGECLDQRKRRRRRRGWTCAKEGPRSFSSVETRGSQNFGYCLVRIAKKWGRLFASNREKSKGKVSNHLRK